MLKNILGLSIISSYILMSCNRSVAPLTQMTRPDSVRAVMIASGSSALGPSEPTICINPTNHKNIVAGAILDNVYVSNDGGETWYGQQLMSSSGVYGDPVIRADKNGHFYYSHLSNPSDRAWRSQDFLDRIVIQKSKDGGKTWTDGSYTTPNPSKDQDKQWLAIHPDNGQIYMTWTEFDKYGSRESSDKSRILFSSSNDGGISWTAPRAINALEGDCLDDDQTTEGAVPAVGPKGEIYVSWSYDEKIYFDKSLDNGKTWLKNDLLVTDQPGGWAYDVPGIMRCNGLPFTEVDLSEGPYKGTIYINWTDQRNGIDDTDVWICRSRDGGETWSKPIRVNNDTTVSHQFFTAFDVDPETGIVYVVFHDRRFHQDTTTDVFLAYSTDGGNNFENIRINSESFVPSPFVFFGDYNDICALNGIVRPIWTQLSGRELSIWTALLEFGKDSNR